MNCNTGELRRMAASMTEAEMEIFLREFTPVPDEHQEEAAKLLADRESVFVDMEKGTQLGKWAKSQQKPQPHTGPNRKRRRMIAKESRRKNRK